MLIEEVRENVVDLVAELNFAEKVERSLDLIRRAYEEFGEGLVLAHSLGKDSSVIWHLAKQAQPEIPGFIVNILLQNTTDITFTPLRHTQRTCRVPRAICRQTKRATGHILLFQGSLKDGRYVLRTCSIRSNIGSSPGDSQ